jgi:hypothetical protein
MGIIRGEVLFDQDVMFSMVPFCDNDREFPVVAIHFPWGVDDQRCTEAIHVLSLNQRSLVSIQYEHCESLLMNGHESNMYPIGHRCLWVQHK